jgi:hypothetical protein
MPLPFIYNLNLLEPRLSSNTQTINPMPLVSNSKNISELIAPLFLCRLYLFSTTRLYLDSKYSARKTFNYTTSKHAVQLLPP